MRLPVFDANSRKDADASAHCCHCRFLPCTNGMRNRQGEYRGAFSLPPGINNAATPRRRLQVLAARAFPVKSGSPEMLYLFVQTQFRAQNRFPLLLELL
jgi:hypothetical protein